MEINWIQLGIGAASGGLAGAFVKQAFDSRKNRIQPIENFIDIKPLYTSSENKFVDSEIILKDGTGEYKFSRLYTGTLIITNSGSIDYSTFSLGLTLPETAKFVQVNPGSQDRHHKITFTSKPELSKQIEAFDISLEPFNRGNGYSLDFLIMSKEDIKLTDIAISSPHAVKWVTIGRLPDALLQIANIVLKLGPFTIGLDKKA